MNLRICCLGDLVTDVVVHLDQDPQRGTDTPARITSTRGGSAANVAVAVSAVGGVGRFVGNVGIDPAGDALLLELASTGVEPCVVRSGSTGTIVVLVDATGERSFLTDRGASTQLASMPAGALDDVDLLHIPAYSFTEGPLAETSEQMLGGAVERGIPISISTSSVAALRQYGRESFLELIAAIKPHYLIANHPEFMFLAKGAEAIPGARATVVTNGGGTAVVRRTDRPEIRVPTKTVKPTDTTGAGDAFTGGFLVSRVRGDDYESALGHGHDLAARTLNSRGAKFERD